MILQNVEILIHLSNIVALKITRYITCISQVFALETAGTNEGRQNAPEFLLYFSIIENSNRSQIVRIKIFYFQISWYWSTLDFFKLLNLASQASKLTLSVWIKVWMRQSHVTKRCLNFVKNLCNVHFDVWNTDQLKVAQFHWYCKSIRMFGRRAGAIGKKFLFTNIYQVESRKNWASTIEIWQYAKTKDWLSVWIG